MPHVVPVSVKVAHTDRAVARVLNINIVCDLQLCATFTDTGTTCGTTLQFPGSGPVELRLTLSNTGTSGLDVTSINGLPLSELVDCGDQTTPVVVTLPIHLAAGETTTITGCVPVTCPNGRAFDITAHAEASDNNGTLCVFNASGNRVADDTDHCIASVSCVAPVTCRVTGGGDLYPGDVDHSCIDVCTVLLPGSSSSALVLDHISHGGQLGAPFSQMDCGAILGNLCIRGQWQHNRHYIGKGNPRDQFDVDFHSVTPKGVFDSLSCACLGCCDPARGGFVPADIGPLIHKFQLCNPDDHKVCGPEPRPAPANAIIFSGIGQFSPANPSGGANPARAEWVVFRVYIEDRSEPGGFHPKGAVEPADIYCFQAWRTGVFVSKRPDFCKIEADFRMCLGKANCDFLSELETGAVPIGSLPCPTVCGRTADFQDCGALRNGNQQIHPSTSATCDRPQQLCPQGPTPLETGQVGCSSCPE